MSGGICIYIQRKKWEHLSEMKLLPKNLEGKKNKMREKENLTLPSPLPTTCLTLHSVIHSLIQSEPTVNSKASNPSQQKIVN